MTYSIDDMRDAEWDHEREPDPDLDLGESAPDDAGEVLRTVDEIVEEMVAKDVRVIQDWTFATRFDRYDQERKGE